MCRLDTFLSIISDRVVSDFNSACATPFGKNKRKSFRIIVLNSSNLSD
jgi:hypothetical protein